MDYHLDLDWPTFLANYWQKRPVVIKNAFHQFSDPISADELAGLAMENDIDSRLVSHNNGVWQASSGPFTAFDHLGDQNWSLLVQAVDHWHIPSAQLVKPFLKLPYWRFDDLMVSFSATGGGVGPHIDNYDVFIVQGMGQRRWRVGDALPLKQYCPTPALLHVEPFNALIDEILETGDLLYIPPGFPHEGYSIKPSLSYSIGFRAPNASDLISSFADYLLDYNLAKTHYTDPDLTLRENLATVEPKEVEGLRQLMLDQLNTPEIFSHWLGLLLSTPGHDLDIAIPEPLYQEDEVKTLLQQGEPLLRLSGLKLINVAGHYFVNGGAITCDEPALLAILSQYDRIDHVLLADLLEKPSVLALLTELINSGYWYFSD